MPTQPPPPSPSRLPALPAALHCSDKLPAWMAKVLGEVLKLYVTAVKYCGFTCRPVLRGLWAEGVLFGAPTASLAGMLERATQWGYHVSPHCFLGQPVVVIPHPRMYARPGTTILVGGGAGSCSHHPRRLYTAAPWAAPRPPAQYGTLGPHPSQCLADAACRTQLECTALRCCRWWAW